MGIVHPDAPILKLTGTPYQMGQQHGVQLKGLIDKYTENTRATYKRIGVTGEPLPTLLARHIEQFRKTIPKQIEELKGMAAGAKMSFEELFAVHFCNEIASAQPLDLLIKKLKRTQQECTAFAATQEATLQHRAFLGMNNDSSPTSVSFRVTIVAEPKNGYKYISQSRATDNGGYGVNEKGVAIVAPSVLSRDSGEALARGDLSGIYDRAIARKVLRECASLDDALKIVKQMPGGYQGLNIVIMDGYGSMAKVERSYKKVKIIYPAESSSGDNSVMVATNHFVSNEMNPIGPTKEDTEFDVRLHYMTSSYQRYERMMDLLSQNIGKIDINLLQAAARDHVNYPDLSICRHGELVCTYSSLIAQTHPNPRYIWILTGTPCENQYMEFSLS